MNSEIKMKLILKNETVMTLDGMKHGQFSLILPDGRKIAVLGDLNKEQAERICLSVNAHDDLVLAAKDACLHIADLANSVGANYKKNSTFQRLMSAINKAEGKETK